MTEPVPGWLAAWRARQGNPAQAAQPPAQRVSHPRQGCNGGKQRAGAVAAANRPKPNWHGFVEPQPWPYDGGKRREPVLDTDHNPPRVVRRVGWRTCMACGSPFFSEDVIALRLCDGSEGCRGEERGKPKLPREQEMGHLRGGARQSNRAEA